MSEFNSKSRRQKSLKHSANINIARIEENFRAFISMCVGEKGKRAAQR